MSSSTGSVTPVDVRDRDAARALITARRAAGVRARTPSSGPLGSSRVALGLVHHGRALVAVAAGAVAAILLITAWAAGDGDVLTEQLKVFSLALVGVYLFGIAALAFWANERRRELARLTDVERYVAAVAHRLGLVAGRLVDEGQSGR